MPKAVPGITGQSKPAHIQYSSYLSSLVTQVMGCVTALPACQCRGSLCPQDLMEHASEVANVVEACSVEGRQERLDSLLAGLELCEKALQVPPPSFASCAWARGV